MELMIQIDLKKLDPAITYRDKIYSSGHVSPSILEMP